MDNENLKNRTKRSSSLLWWVGGGLALLLVVTGAWLKTAADRAWLVDVKVYNYEAGIHVEGGLGYAESPAVGGPHNPVWQNCGVYDAPLAQEHVVHSLEHGAVWITYNPASVTSAQSAELTQAYGDDPYVIVSPYTGLSKPVVVSAWNRQLALTGVDDERLAMFVNTFASGPQAPEPGAPCDNGTDMTMQAMDEPPADDVTPGTTPDGMPADTLPGEAITSTQAETLIGASEEQAQQSAENAGWIFRVGERDGEMYMLTKDYITQRVTVTVTDGLITAVEVG
jgi:hypothetical protein